MQSTEGVCTAGSQELKCVPVCCSALQRIAVRYSVLLCVADTAGSQEMRVTGLVDVYIFM